MTGNQDRSKIKKKRDTAGECQEIRTGDEGRERKTVGDCQKKRLSYSKRQRQRDCR